MTTAHGSPVELELDGRAVTVSKPDKPLFGSGVTKLELARYYEAVAAAMLPHVAGRPMNVQRYPDGIERHGIFQQHLGRHFPDWIDRVAVAKEDGTVTHVVASDAAALVYLANQAAVTLHVWSSRRDLLDKPDRLIVDLDPDDHTPDEVRETALAFGALLRDELGLPVYAMATGSRGYHVVVPVQRRLQHERLREFARDAGRIAVARDPDRLTLEFRKRRRGGRLLIDVMRNRYAHTAVAPYSVRARSEAPVATPLAWAELEDPTTRPDRWTVRTVPDRLAADGDPWAGIDDHAVALGDARAKLDALMAELGLT